MPLTNGLVVMTPTSIVSTGTGNSSSINSDGSVSFSSCVTLSLNGVFTSSYDNYMIVKRDKSNTGNNAIYVRLRLSGTDATGANYTHQFVAANGTTVSGFRYTADTFCRFGNTDTLESGDVISVYGPALSQPTAFRNTSVGGFSSAVIVDFASTHSLSTSYDGITIYPVSGNFTGLLTVFGFNQ
jgi:hypothetical protein